MATDGQQEPLGTTFRLRIVNLGLDSFTGLKSRMKRQERCCCYFAHVVGHVRLCVHSLYKLNGQSLSNLLLVELSLFPFLCGCVCLSIFHQQRSSGTDRIPPAARSIRSRSLAVADSNIGLCVLCSLALHCFIK